LQKMAKKTCKTCAASGGVYGFDNAPYMEIASAVAGAVVLGKVDEMVTTEDDGTAKDNYFANNPTIKNVAYVAAGVAMTALLPGEMYKGVGIGMAAYGGYALVTDLMKTDAVSGINGLKFVPPRNIAAVNGLRTLTGNYGVAPGLIAGYEGSNYAKEQVIDSTRRYDEAEQTPINGLYGLTRAL
jgi:hypothetical protein